MFHYFPSLCSTANSYWVNYEIQSCLYNWLDDNTEEPTHLKSLGFAVWCVSSLVTTITRIAGIAEVFFVGLGILLTAPLTAKPIENAKIGLNEIFVHTPKNVLRTVSTIAEFLFGALYLFFGYESCFDAKGFTMNMVEYMKFNLKHARNGTIHSDEHKNDLRCVDGIAGRRFKQYQKRTWERLENLEAQNPMS
jgi:hypothetical protein